MSRSGSVSNHRGSSASAQVSRFNSEISLHTSPPATLHTSSAGQYRDDGDGTSPSPLIGVTSFAPGSRSTISTVSKDISSTTVLKSENQSSDKSSTSKATFIDQQVTETSPSLKSSLGDEGSKIGNGNIKSTPIDTRFYSAPYSNVITSSVISVDVNKRVEKEKSVSWIIDSKRDDYSTSCTIGSRCISSTDSSFPDLLFTSVSSATFEIPSISSTPVLKEPIATEIQKPIASVHNGRYSSLKRLSDVTSTSYSINVITPSWNSDIYDISVTSTRLNEPSRYLVSSTQSPSVYERLHEHTTNLDKKETFLVVTSDSSPFAHHLFSASKAQTEFYQTSTTIPSSIFLHPSLNHNPESDTQYQKDCSAVNCSGRVVSNSWSLEGFHSSSKLPLPDSPTATMMQLLPSHTPSFETFDVSRSSLSPTLTPVLPKPPSKTPTLVTTPAAPSPFPVETYTKSTDILLTTLTSSLDPFIRISHSVSSSRNPPVSSKSIQPSSPSISISPSLTPPLTSQREYSRFTNTAFDPEYPTSSSSLPVTPSVRTQPDLDAPASNDQPSIISRKNSLTSPPSKSVASPALTSASISSSSTFQTSVLPSASVIGDDHGNSTVVPPGKVDTNHDDGFMSGSSPIIIGAACGVFVVGVVIIIVVACALRRKRIDKAPKRDPRMDDLWVDIGRSDDRFPAPSVDPCLNVYDSQLPVKSDQQLYRATQSYTSKENGYLSFIVGDLIRIIEVSDHDWWRGLAVKDGTTGWFPNDCVEEAKEIRPTDRERYSTIDEEKMDTQGHTSSFQIRRVDPEDTRPLVQENVAVHGTLESKDVTDDVASWVKMAASVSMTSLRSIDTIGTCSTLNDYSTSVKGVHFRAIYAYKPVCKGEMGLKEGELVVCKERDRNGWMLGIKPKTKDEGWFPAVYVDAVSSEDATLREEDVPAIYELLDSNKLHNANQAWTGIEHKAVGSYTSEILGDLSFQCDEVIIVFQTLANGWWFGSKDKQSGWFPGAYVEMIEDESEAANNLCTADVTSPHQLSNTNGYAKDMLSPELSPLRSDLLLELKHENGKNGDPNHFSFSATNSPRDSIASSVISDNDLKPLVSPKHATMDGRFRKAIRPIRKAPAPPTSLMAAKTKDSLHVDGTNSLRRPVRRAPAPPTRKPSKGESDLTSLTPDGMNSGRDTPTFRKPLYLINGKRPKLVRVSPDIFDDKSLNPVIRPATRGLAPVLSTPTSTSMDSSVPKHGYGVHNMMKNGHEVEHHVKPRPLTPLHLRFAEHRHSSASRASYGSNTDTVTSDHISSEYRHSPFQDHTKEPYVLTCNVSRSSTPTILQGSGHKSSKTVTTVSPPVVPKMAYDANCNDLQYSSPSPPPPPPPEEPVESFHHLEDKIKEAPKVNLSKFNDNVSISNNDTSIPIQNNDTGKDSNSTDTLTDVNVNHQPFRRMSSNQRVAPSTLPKPRLNSNNSFSSFGKGSEHHNGMSEKDLATMNSLSQVDVQGRPLEASRSLGPSPSRDSFALVPGKVSEIVHHLNSLSPDSVFPPLLDGTELSLIIPQRKGSNTGPNTPKSIDTISQVDPHNGHDIFHQDQSSTNSWNATKEIPYDLSQINQDILHKNTFVPIKDELHQIEDRVSTFRSLPRPSRKRSKDAVSLTNEDAILSNIKSEQYFPFFKPILHEKVTEL